MPALVICLGMLTSPMDIELFVFPAIPKCTIPFILNTSINCCVAAAAFTCTFFS